MIPNFNLPPIHFLNTRVQDNKVYTQDFLGNHSTVIGHKSPLPNNNTIYNPLGNPIGEVDIFNRFNPK